VGRKIERRFEDECDVMVSWLKFLVVSVFYGLRAH
jgi:hypothetical protein